MPPSGLAGCPATTSTGAEAAVGLSALPAGVAAAADAAASPYRSRFTQGANLVPRVLVTVDLAPAGPLGVSAGRIPVHSFRSANEKQPWKNLPSLEGIIEERFVRPVHFGETMVAYRARKPRLTIVPWADGELLDGDSERLDEFSGLAAWWREAERLWNRHKSATTRLSPREQIDFQGKLRRQLPAPPERVVYTKSGQHLAACRVDDPEAVIDHKLYWAPAASVAEARYLCAVLNSRALADAVAPLQARGQHNPRDFDLHVFALSFPLFEPEEATHRELADLAARAEEVAAEVDLEGARQFQKARRRVREALREDGVAVDIDEAVWELLISTPAVRTRGRASSLLASA